MKIRAKLTVLVLCALAVCGCSGGGDTVTPPVDDFLPFDGTHTYTVSGVNAAGFTNANVTFRISDLAVAPRAATPSEVSVLLWSSDGMFNATVMTVTSLTANRIAGTAVTTDGRTATVVITIAADGGAITVQVSFPGGATFGGTGAPASDTVTPVVNFAPTAAVTVNPSSLRFVGGSIQARLQTSDPENDTLAVSGTVTGVGGPFALTFVAGANGLYTASATLPANITSTDRVYTVSTTVTDGKHPTVVATGSATVAGVTTPPTPGI